MSRKYQNTRMYIFHSLLSLFIVFATISAVAPAQAQPKQEKYAYDVLGRLRKVTFADGKVVDYTYDAAGNRRVQSAEGTVSSTDTLTLTSGTYNCGPNNCPYALYGYVRSSGLSTIGTVSSNALLGGRTLVSLYDRHKGDFTFAFEYSEIVVSGFTADPGKGWLISAMARCTTKSASTATYSYSAGTATWRWTNSWGFLGGTCTSNQVVLTRN